MEELKGIISAKNAKKSSPINGLRAAIAGTTLLLISGCGSTSSTDNTETSNLIDDVIRYNPLEVRENQVNPYENCSDGTPVLAISYLNAPGEYRCPAGENNS